jgi:hypothetical protein
MKTRELANIVLKAMGIYWLVEAMLHILRGVLMPFSNMGNLPDNIVKIEIINWIVVGVIYATMSYLLILRTESILKLIKLDEDREPTTSEESTIDYKALSFALLGMYFLVTSLSAIVPQLIKIWTLQQPPPTARMFQEAYLEKSWTSLLEHAIQLIFGAVLVIGRYRLTKLLQRLRPLSTPSEEESETKL